MGCIGDPLTHASPLPAFAGAVQQADGELYAPLLRPPRWPRLVIDTQQHTIQNPWWGKIKPKPHDALQQLQWEKQQLVHTA